MGRPIRSTEEFFAHALAIEQEAVDRYAEFEAWFGDRGEPVLAGLCAAIAREERRHLAAIRRASVGLELPALQPGEHAWLEQGSPEAPAREVFYRLVNARQLLEVALEGERGALGFFEWVATTARDSDLRRLALEYAREEEQHVRWLRDALEYRPATKIDWDEVLDHRD